ncbi:uncharacterized protein LOC108414147 isoform X2 [Pygocentrus nattereri]|uniref:uncharacterized protein LOC108414147 isoform X2 n=1 Tax=Pygocentrus nattereri TaxID=42514 RepID=UPI001891223C|nr:uncharacterized protein LOC108414147 isoform X2 [Pygocentrus nattereri]
MEAHRSVFSASLLRRVFRGLPGAAVSVMPFCSSALRVLIFLTVMFIPDDQPGQRAAVPVWLPVLLLTVFGVLSMVIGWMWRKKQQLQKRSGGNRMRNHNGEKTMKKRRSLSVMPSRSSALRVLIFLTVTFIPVSESANPSVRVKFNETATLPCSERCSGLVRWTEFSKSTDVLAECDQTSCRSVKEGYQMIHDQYLKGNLSLIITAVDFTKRGLYTCDCDDKDLCDVTLKIEPLNTKIQKKPGESLFLDLDIPEEVEMIYNRTVAAGPSSGQICRVVGRSLQCKPDYKQRTSLASTFVLRGATPSDSGVYTIMDKRNEEAVHSYTVIVEDDQPCRDQGAALPGWVVPVLAVLLTASVGINFWQRRENQQLRKKPEGSGVVKEDQNGADMNGLGKPGAEEQHRLAPPSNDLEAV